MSQTGCGPNALFYHSKVTTSWDSAKQQCEHIGGYLVMFNNILELKYVLKERWEPCCICVWEFSHYWILCSCVTSQNTFLNYSSVMFFLLVFQEEGCLVFPKRNWQRHCLEAHRFLLNSFQISESEFWKMLLSGAKRE